MSAGACGSPADAAVLVPSLAPGSWPQLPAGQAPEIGRRPLPPTLRAAGLPPCTSRRPPGLVDGPRSQDRRHAAMALDLTPGQATAGHATGSAASVNMAEATGCAKGGQPGPVDPSDLKNLEVAHYHWNSCRCQLDALKGELGDVRRAVQELQEAGSHRQAWEERTAQELRGAYTGLKDTEDRCTTELARLAAEVQAKHWRLDEDLRAALRDVDALVRTELARVDEGQRQLWAKCALRKDSEATETALRKEVSQVAKEDQSRYAQHNDFVQLALKEMGAKLERECAQMAEEHRLYKLEVIDRLHAVVDAADFERMKDLARLSEEHHSRHDEIRRALRASSEDLRKELAEKTGQLADAHQRHCGELQKHNDDTLEELDMKIAEVEALYSEAAEKRREAWALSWKFSTQ